jgi:hypothetical protein
MKICNKVKYCCGRRNMGLFEVLTVVTEECYKYVKQCSLF